MLLEAYRRFEVRVGEVPAHGGKSALVASVIGWLPGTFSYSDVANACPGVSRPTIKRVLNDLRRQGKIECVRRGRFSLWRRQWDHQGM